MLFNSIDFVIFFVIVVGIFMSIKYRKFQHSFLLIASYFFFYYSSNYLIALLIFTTIWDFYLGLQLYKAQDQRRKKAILVTSIAGNLSLLGFFKYADFAVAQFNVLGNYFNLYQEIPLLNLALPIGISFYTFHSVGYIIDVYRGKIQPSRSLREYAIFIAFFPQLVAGPILRASHFLPQLVEKAQSIELETRLRQIIVQNQNFKFGITLMMFGFFKKVFLADNIAPMVNEIFASPIGTDSFIIILGTLAFGIQIYCDFSGYSDIAIGAASVLGFKIPVNFNKPYFASTPSDFWHRWHISLSSWLRDYLYIPLGGNRKSEARTYFNLFAVMFLGGLWHGASWNFVIWGLLHGGYLAVQKAFANNRLHGKTFFKSSSWVIISILITQYFVFLAWIPFRVSDTDSMMYSMGKYLIIDFKTDSFLDFTLEHRFPLLVMLTFFIIFMISYRVDDYAQKVADFKLRYWLLFLAIMMAVVILSFNGDPEQFIYFQF